MTPLMHYHAMHYFGMHYHGGPVATFYHGLHALALHAASVWYLLVVLVIATVVSVAGYRRTHATHR